jgi:hypothetical protein
MPSLLDLIGSAEGTPSANYLKGGRTVLKVSRLSFREPTPKLPRPSFRLDGEILKSTNPIHQGQAGSTGTVNLSFRFADQDLAKMRRALRACIASKEGRDDVTESEAAERAVQVVGEKQPLTGAVIVIDALEAPQKGDASKTFTRYEVVVPTERDLDGLI